MDFIFPHSAGSMPQTTQVNYTKSLAVVYPQAPATNRLESGVYDSSERGCSRPEQDS